MELDEIIYATGELYLKYRKEQQIRADMQQQLEKTAEQLSEKEARIEELELELGNTEPDRQGREE